MQPKLKEDPAEWQKFTIVMAILAAAPAVFLASKDLIPTSCLAAWMVLLALALALSGLKPAWFRPFYRRGMTLCFHLGQFIGRITLTLFFLLVVTPLGWLLRLSGKDLLSLRPSHQDSYWQPAAKPSQFHKLF